MKSKKIFGKKQLSFAVAAAFSFGAAFSVAPSDALAATVNITQQGANYVIDTDGKIETYDKKEAFAAAFKAAVGASNNVVTVTNGARQVITGVGTFDIGAGTTLNVNTPTNPNNVTINAGSNPSKLTVTAEGVTGSNVDLDSLTVQASNQTADVNLTGKVGALNTIGASKIYLTTTGGTLNVDTIKVANGTELNGSSATINAKTADLQGATVSGTTLTADTVYVGDNTTLTNSLVKAAVVEPTNSTAAAVADLIKSGAISAKEGSKLIIHTEGLNAQAVAAVTALGDKAVTTNAQNEYKLTNGQALSLDGTDYTGSTLAKGIETAYSLGTETIQLDRTTAAQLKNQKLAVPANKQLRLMEGKNIVSVQTKDATEIILVNGTTVKAANGSLATVYVDAPDQTITADLSGLTSAGDVTVYAGIVNAGDRVKAGTVNIGKDAKITAGTLTAEKIVVDGLDKLNGIATLAAADGKSIIVQKPGGMPYTEKELAAIVSKVPSSQTLVSGKSSIQGTGKPVVVFDANDPAAALKALDDKYDANATNPNKTYRESVDGNATALEAASILATYNASSYNPFTTGPDAVPVASQAMLDNINATVYDETLKKYKYSSTDLSTLNNTLKDLQTDIAALSDADKSKADVAAVKSYVDGLVGTNGSANLVEDAYKAVQAVEAAGAGATDEQKAAATKAVAALNAYQSNALRSASITKGQIAAAPSLAGFRAANAINSVIASNITGRTADLRGGAIAAAAPERAAGTPNNLWFQIRHSDQDVDGSDGYADSTVKATTYQIGYDYQVSGVDYIGLYASTTTGSVDFGGAFPGSADIDDSFDAGIYGTRLLPKNQYIDYLVHAGKFSMDYANTSMTTNNYGFLVGYGAKIRSDENLVLNPYINFAYDTLTYSDATYGNGNTIRVDDQHNFSTKLGINFDWDNGLNLGLAYSRGLSGSYNPYIRNIAMPGVDNDYNVFYVSLGYKNFLNPTTYLDVSVDKTFADYDGWVASGRVNFFF